VKVPGEQEVARLRAAGLRVTKKKKRSMKKI